MTSHLHTHITARPNTPAEKHRAAAWICGHYLDQHPDANPHQPTPQQREAVLELLRPLGLAHDPHAIDINPLTKTARRRGPQEGDQHQ